MCWTGIVIETCGFLATAYQAEASHDQTVNVIRRLPFTSPLDIMMHLSIYNVQMALACCTSILLRSRCSPQAKPLQRAQASLRNPLRPHSPVP